jgi:hypothetical protein
MGDQNGSLDQELGAFLSREASRRTAGRRSDRDVVAAIVAGHAAQPRLSRAVVAAGTAALGLALVVVAVLALGNFQGLISAGSTASPATATPERVLNGGLSCPVSQGATLTSDLPPGSAFGARPVYAVFAESRRTAFYDDDLSVWKRIDVLLVAEPGFSGLVTVRGADLHGPGGISFGDPTERTPSPSIVIDGSQAMPLRANGWVVLAALPILVQGPGCYEVEIDTGSTSSTFVFEARAVEDAWVQLTRPLVLPGVASGEVCPATPTSGEMRFQGWLGSVRGLGPVYWAGGGGVSIWVADPRELGPILIRGGRIDGPGELGFDSELHPSPVLRLPIHSSVTSGGQPLGWRQFVSGLYPSSPGCYAVQIDTLQGTSHLVLRLGS